VRSSTFVLDRPVCSPGGRTFLFRKQALKQSGQRSPSAQITTKAPLCSHILAQKTPAGSDAQTKLWLAHGLKVLTSQEINGMDFRVLEESQLSESQLPLIRSKSLCFA
jgi:hypothetical protein